MNLTRYFTRLSKIKSKRLQNILNLLFQFGRKKKKFRKIKSGESQVDYDREKAKAEQGNKKNGRSEPDEPEEVRGCHESYVVRKLLFGT